MNEREQRLNLRVEESEVKYSKMHIQLGRESEGEEMRGATLNLNPEMNRSRGIIRVSEKSEGTELEIEQFFPSSLSFTSSSAPRFLFPFPIQYILN